MQRAGKRSSRVKRAVMRAGAVRAQAELREHLVRNQQALAQVITLRADFAEQLAVRTCAV